MKKIVTAAILLLILNIYPVQAQEKFEIADIRVEGLSRISAETVFSYLPIGIGDEIDEESSRQIVKKLFKTGFFRDIKLRHEDGVLVIALIERPSIATIRITGNKDIDDEQFQEVVGYIEFLKKNPS